MVKGRYAATIEIEFNWDNTDKPEKIFETVKDYVESGKMTTNIQNMINTDVIGDEKIGVATVTQNYAEVYRNGCGDCDNCDEWDEHDKCCCVGCEECMSCDNEGCPWHPYNRC